MQHANCKCPKCGAVEYDVGEFRATGGILTKILDIQSSCSDQRWAIITLKSCPPSG